MSGVVARNEVLERKRFDLQIVNWKSRERLKHRAERALDIELDPPAAGEVLVKLAASGLCHSDEHLVTGDLPFALPIIGGHEGAGVVQEVGEGVSWLAPGDHVVFGFIPSCGRCPSC